MKFDSVMVSALGSTIAERLANVHNQKVSSSRYATMSVAIRTITTMKAASSVQMSPAHLSYELMQGLGNWRSSLTGTTISTGS